MYLVATPIGNLSDISLRALDIFRNVDFIASEDTRKTGRLLKRFEIKKPQISFHEYNKESSKKRIIKLLKNKKSVALVTNAGTPGISDPGFSIVRLAINLGIEISLIPGPSAFIMALVLSGLPVHGFTFRGFSPRKSNSRLKFFEIDRDSPHTLIFYESPHRIKAFLEDAIQVFGDRQAAVANDLTKMYEKMHRGTLSELLILFNENKPRGEYTVVIASALSRINFSDTTI